MDRGCPLQASQLRAIRLNNSLCFRACAIAFDRFFAIFRPLKRVITFRVAKFIIAASWVSAIIVSGPSLYTLKTTGERGFAQCIEKWEPPFNEATASRDYTIALFCLLYAFPLTVIASLYTVIMLKLWRRKAPGQELTSNQENKEKTNRKVLKMLVTVVVVFALSWLPLYVRMFVMFAKSDHYACGLPYEMDFLTLFLGHANSAVNPYIYVIFNENYRRGFRTVLSRWDWESKSSSSKQPGEPGQVGCKKKKQFSCAHIRAKTEWANEEVIGKT